jgi:DNA-binding response OmpR family regulator
LTASKAEGGELEGLELGADDFVTKPVDPRILLARVRSVLRRAVNSDSASSGAPPVVVANLWLDQSSRVAKVNGAAVELTSTEWSLLWVLASRAGTVVSRDDLYTEALGTTYDGLDRGVDIHLSRLRKKLAAAGFDPAAIKSVRSVGYLMGR